VECNVTWQLPAPPGSTTLRILPLQSPRDSGRARSLSVSAARDQVGCDREQGEGKGDPGQVKGRTGRDDDPERLLSLDLNLVDEFVLLDNGSPDGGSNQQGQSGNDRHDSGDGKSQSVGDNTKDQSQESCSASDDHEDGSNLGQIAVEALASELVGLVGDDVVGLNEELHRRITQDGLQRLELDGEPGRVTDSTLLGVSTRVEDTPSVFLTETGVLSQGSGTVGHVETVRCGLHGVLQTGTVSGDIELDHVNGFGERSRVDLSDDGKDHQDDRDEREDGSSGDTVFSSHCV